MSPGTLHKYLLYFDSTFPYLHQNSVTITLGTSYGVNKGVDVFKTMAQPQGTYAKSLTYYPMGQVEERTDDLHTATYLAGSRDLSLVYADHYTDDYTNVSLVKDSNSKIHYLFGTAYSLRTQVIIIRGREYNPASRCLGTSTLRIATRNILFHDPEFADVTVPLSGAVNSLIARVEHTLNAYARLELGAATHCRILNLEKEKEAQFSLSEAESAAFDTEGAALQAQYQTECAGEISDAARARNKRLAKELYLSVCSRPYRKRIHLLRTLLEAFRRAMELGLDLSDETQLSGIFGDITFRVRYLDETPQALHRISTLNLAKADCIQDWTRIRSSKIATVFQDPMTSLNPVLTISKQITSVIINHQKVSEAEAWQKALELMKKVGIPNVENRFDDNQFQYSGGMRQRIAIALSCQSRILICDEPTTALDVTIQAQTLKLIKGLQKEFHYTIVFITHDLSVVANIADRVAVLYAGPATTVSGMTGGFDEDARHALMQADIFSYYIWAMGCSTQVPNECSF